MPPGKKNKTITKSSSSFDFNGDDQSSPSCTNGAADLPNTSMRARKRPHYEQEIDQEDCDETGNFTGEMQTLISGFGADISKTLDTKRKRLESFTQAAVKTSNRKERKVEEIFQRQQRERGKLRDEYQKQMLAVLTQMESDMDKTKDAEEKLEELFKQQQKLIQQQCVVHANRLKSMRNIHDQYSKGMKELERSQLEQQGSVQHELRQELGYLQKKILHETQNQEMANVRKTLQTMLAQV